MDRVEEEVGAGTRTRARARARLGQHHTARFHFVTMRGCLWLCAWVPCVVLEPGDGCAARMRCREELDGCTFKPAINHDVDAPPIREENSNVWEWLAKPKKKQQPYKDPQVTFHPAINPTSKHKVLYCTRCFAAVSVRGARGKKESGQ